MQIDYSQYARLRLETKHALVVSLVLPSRAVHHGHTLVIADIVTVYMACDEDVRNCGDNQPVLWLG